MLEKVKQVIGGQNTYCFQPATIFNDWTYPELPQFYKLPRPYYFRKEVVGFLFSNIKL